MKHKRNNLTFLACAMPSFHRTSFKLHTASSSRSLCTSRPPPDPLRDDGFGIEFAKPAASWNRLCSICSNKMLIMEFPAWFKNPMCYYTINMCSSLRLPKQRINSTVRKKWEVVCWRLTQMVDCFQNLPQISFNSKIINKHL